MLVARAHKARAGAVLTRVLRLGFSVASLALLSVRSEAHEPSRVGVPILTALRVTALQDRVLAEYDIALEATSVTTPLRMTFGYGSPGVYSSASAAVVFETASGQLESIPAAISRTWSPPAGLVSIGAKDEAGMAIVLPRPALMAASRSPRTRFLLRVTVELPRTKEGPPSLVLPVGGPVIETMPLWSVRFENKSDAEISSLNVSLCGRDGNGARPLAAEWISGAGKIVNKTSGSAPLLAPRRPSDRLCVTWSETHASKRLTSESPAKSPEEPNSRRATRSATAADARTPLPPPPPQAAREV